MTARPPRRHLRTHVPRILEFLEAIERRDDRDHNNRRIRRSRGLHPARLTSVTDFEIKESLFEVAVRHFRPHKVDNRIVIPIDRDQRLLPAEVEPNGILIILTRSS